MIPKQAKHSKQAKSMRTYNEIISINVWYASSEKEHHSMIVTSIR